MSEVSEYFKLKELQSLQKRYGLLFYEPFPKQDMFHANGDKLRRYVRTGNRFGKSTLGAAEDCAWAIGERVWYPRGDIRRTIGIPQRPTKGLIIVADWEKAHEIFTNTSDGIGRGKLFKLLPESMITKKRTGANGIIFEIGVQSVWGGESIIMLDTVKSFKANPMGQESSDWDWIHVDEPCPKEMWVANSRGLVDRGGSAWFTCTPINEAWINDMFLPRKAFRKGVDGAVMIDENHWMITGSSYDNPHNSENSLKMFEKDLTEQEKQCRIQGIPLALSGLVYKEFDHELHVMEKPPKGWDGWLRPPKDYTLRVFIDPHPSTPHAVLFTATSPQGFVFYYHEIFRQCFVHDLADAINEIIFGYDPFEIRIDPAAYVTNPIDGTTMADVFVNNGLFVTKAPKDLSNGIMATQAFLGSRITTDKGLKLPKCFFAPHLSETLWEFDHYEWSSKRKDKPVDKDDHMMENLYRSVLVGVDRYITPTQNTEPIAPTSYQRVYTPSLRI
jgi:hypothetical protein